jgi:hypothetical protein
MGEGRGEGQEKQGKFSEAGVNASLAFFVV